MNAEELEKKFPGEGMARFSEIALLGGFGAVGVEPGSLDPSTTLDLAGVLEPDNKAVSAAAKAKIRSLSGEKSEAKEVTK